MAVDRTGAFVPTEVSKRKLPGALRRERRQAGMTQRYAAEYLSWSQRRLARVERDASNVGPDDVRRLLDLYEVRDDRRVRELVELAEVTTDRAWSVYRDEFSNAALTLFENEPAADSILKYEPTFMPAIVQTERYTRSLLSALGHTPHAIETRLEVIRTRRSIFEGQSPPGLALVLGEAVLRRPVGGADVMRDQVAALRRFAETGLVSLQVLPFEAGQHPGIGEAFTILRFNDADLDDLLFLEDAGRRSRALESDRLVARHRKIFENLQRIAVGPGYSLQAIDVIAAAATAS